MRRPLAQSLCQPAPLRAWPLLGVLCLLSACASPYSERPTDPPFGQSVRRALQAQQLPSAPTAPPAGVPYTELEPALDRQQKAKPVESTQNRSSQSGQGGYGLMGP